MLFEGQQHELEEDPSQQLRASSQQEETLKLITPLRDINLTTAVAMGPLERHMRKTNQSVLPMSEWAWCMRPWDALHHTYTGTPCAIS